MFQFTFSAGSQHHHHHTQLIIKVLSMSNTIDILQSLKSVARAVRVLYKRVAGINFGNILCSFVRKTRRKPSPTLCMKNTESLLLPFV